MKKTKFFRIHRMDEKQNNHRGYLDYLRHSGRAAYKLQCEAICQSISVNVQKRRYRCHKNYV